MKNKKFISFKTLAGKIAVCATINARDMQKDGTLEPGYDNLQEHCRNNFEAYAEGHTRYREIRDLAGVYADDVEKHYMDIFEGYLVD